MDRRGTFLLGVIGCLALTGCASAHHAAKAAASAQPASVQSTFERFFDTNTSVAQRESLLQNGPAFAPVLTAQAHAGASAVKVGDVKFSDPSHATVSFSLTVAPSTRLPSIAGAAVLVGSGWQVSSSTMCVVLAATGQHAAACN